MPSTPKPGPANDWPEAPENSPVPQDDVHPHEVGNEPAGNQQAQPNGASEDEGGAAGHSSPTDGGATHRPPLAPGEIPAAWLPQPDQDRQDQDRQDQPGSSAPGQDADPRATHAEPRDQDGQSPDGQGSFGEGEPYPTSPDLHSAYPQPSGQYPTPPQGPGAPGQNPVGQSPAAPQYPAYPQPAGQYPTYPQDPGAPGQNPAGPPPTGQYPTYPQGPGAPGQYPPGQPGSNPSGAWFQGQYPPGQYPPGQQPGQQFPPGGPGWNLPERKRKSLEEVKASALRTRERLRLFIIMVIGLLVVSQLPLPFRLAGIALGLASGFVGIRVLIGLAEMRRSGMGARGVVFTLFGLGLTGMLLLVLVSQAVYYPVVSDLEKCQARANTEAADQACVDETNDRFNNILDDLNKRARTN